jgi:hypothetical protein
MESINLELQIIELKERNKFLESEYKWIWELYKDTRFQLWHALEAKKKKSSRRAV